jgi:hypothetical protein
VYSDVFKSGYTSIHGLPVVLYLDGVKRSVECTIRAAVHSITARTFHMMVDRFINSNTQDEPRHSIRTVTPTSSVKIGAPPRSIAFSRSNGDDHSTASFTTLLSVPSSSLLEEEEEDLESETGYDKLVRGFAHRNKMLDRICEGRSDAYARMLRRNEELVREEAFKLFAEERPREKATPQTTQATWTSAIWSTILFDCHHTGRAAIVLLCYCAAHLSIYEAIASLVYENSRKIINQDAFYLGLVLFALALSRLSGGLWYYTSDANYRATKFDLHNRLRLRMWDAKLLRWFVRHPTIKFTADYLAIYLALIGTSFFLSKFMGAFDQREALLAKLPSAEHGVTTLVTERLLDHPYAPNTTAACLEDSLCAHQEFHRSLHRQDELFLWDNLGVSAYVGVIGDATAKAVSQERFFAFYFVVGSAAIALMTWMGFDFE